MLRKLLSGAVTVYISAVQFINFKAKFNHVLSRSKYGVQWTCLCSDSKLQILCIFMGRQFWCVCTCTDGRTKSSTPKTNEWIWAKNNRLPVFRSWSPNQSLIIGTWVMSVFTCVKVDPCTDSLTQACGRLGLKYNKPVFFTGLLPQTHKIHRLGQWYFEMDSKEKTTGRDVSLVSDRTVLSVQNSNVVIEPQTSSLGNTFKNL